MGPDVLRRVRWGNVALTAAVLAALAAVSAWPRLAPAPSRLPSDTAQPVVEEATQRQAAPAPRAQPARRREEPAGKSRRAKSRGEDGSGRRPTSRAGPPPRSGGRRRTSPAGAPPRHAAPPGDPAP